ncbi:Uncharacterised protein [Mycobacteroides abscessus subsp. abscessus]|nr:Uncharacterised protein [Mycobacteroides abscessus subsp. abscessus]SIL44564.1 Uncharacterised protein [Mycobacteroides abscessus subsp. abscessus]
MPSATHLIPFIDNDEVVDPFALQSDTSSNAAESSPDHCHLVIRLFQLSRRCVPCGRAHDSRLL